MHFGTSKPLTEILWMYGAVKSMSVGSTVQRNEKPQGRLVIEAASVNQMTFQSLVKTHVRSTVHKANIKTSGISSVARTTRLSPHQLQRQGIHRTHS